MTSAKKAGSYELISFKIYKLGEPGNFIDLKAVIPSWEITESLNSGHMHGSAYVIDAVGILDKFLDEENGWLKGEEEVEIVYTDFFEQIELTHRCFVYSITDVKRQLTANETAMSFTLHFVSLEKFYTEKFMLRRSYSGGLISDYVQSVFDQYYVDEVDSPEPAEIKIFEGGTSGNQTLVVPNYSPEQTMHFFARKAYSEETDGRSGTFRFFQNRDQYYFTTHEDLVFEPIGNPEDDIILYQQFNTSVQTPSGQLLLMQNIIDIEFPSHVNTIQDMVEGAYYRKTTELDFLNKSAYFTEYRYLDEYQNYLLPGDGPGGNNVEGVPNSTRSKHSKEFVDEHMSYLRDNLVIKDYPLLGSSSPNFELRPHTYYNRTYNEKRVNFYHHTNEKVTMRVYGRNDVKAGSLIAIEILRANANLGEREIDTERSGVYLVETIRNVFDQDAYYQVITMSKSGYSGEKEPAQGYNREPQIINIASEASDTAAQNGVGQAGGTDSTITAGPDDGLRGTSGNATQVPTTEGDFTGIVVPRGFDENGNPYVDVRLADGSIVRRTGARNWRNNNPGNIEYGAFAQSLGAIGSDGRFAIFPSYEAGRRAKEELLFNTSSYRDLTLSQAVNRYAPSFENDTQTYINTVASRTGVSINTRMSDIPLETRSQLLDAFEAVEGYAEGDVTVIRNPSEGNA